jgi:FAD/FMN-containing dehydrogenase
VPVDLSPLREHFQGVITTPSSPTYERERVLFNTRIRYRPQVLARCSSTEDVVAAVRFARDVGMPFAVRGGGHHACGFSLAEDGLVVDTGGLRTVSYDAASGTAVAGAGAGWREVDAVTGAAGRYAPGGECPTVSNAGYSLGGGYGLLSRTFGLACDHIEAAEVVDATGAVLSVTEESHPDLLWALRGAGAGGFGVVTRIRYRLDPVPATVLGGVIGWPIDHAEEVFRAYRDLYEGGGGDDRLSLFALLTTDPYPEGDPVAVLYGLYAGPVADGEAALAPIRSLGAPLFDAFEPTTYVGLQDVLGEEILYGLQLKWRSGYFREGGFSDDAFATIVDRFRRAPSGYSMARFDLLGGGAIGRVPASATAFAHRDAVFNISAIALWEAEEETAANVAWADDLKAALTPHLSGAVYPNYADEDLLDWTAAYYGANYARLQEVKRRYDPDDFLHHPQSVRLP